MYRVVTNVANERYIEQMSTQGHPKYLMIAQAIQARITAGELPEGKMLPGEGVLAEEFGVTRNTVRKALDALRRNGIIGTAQGTGSWVRRTAPRRYLGIDRYRAGAGRGTPHSMVLTEDPAVPVQGGTAVRTSVRPARELPPRLAQWLAVDPDDDLVRRDALFTVDNRGQQLWTSWLPMSRARGTALTDPGTDPWSETTIEHYERLGGWQFAYARESKWPRMPDPVTAEQLGITTGIPLLVVERAMYFRDRAGELVPLEVAVVLLPGDSTIVEDHVPAPLH